MLTKSKKKKHKYKQDANAKMTWSIKEWLDMIFDLKYTSFKRNTNELEVFRAFHTVFIVHTNTAEFVGQWYKSSLTLNV